jgi:hypothetical protein
VTGETESGPPAHTFKTDKSCQQGFATVGIFSQLVKSLREGDRRAGAEMVAIDFFRTKHLL